MGVDILQMTRPLGLFLKIKLWEDDRIVLRFRWCMRGCLRLCCLLQMLLTNSTSLLILGQDIGLVWVPGCMSQNARSCIMYFLFWIVSSVFDALASLLMSCWALGNSQRCFLTKWFIMKKQRYLMMVRSLKMSRKRANGWTWVSKRMCAEVHIVP